jgi:leucyl/phenylalanyl-tRNA--protein transferase
MFYGESMFSRIPEASKIALAVLVHVMRNERVPVIDCQQNTRHLASLGAREVSRAEFVGHLNVAVRAAPINWTAYTKR